MISVIIPVYNVELYLEKCLSSIITNTYPNLEIICVNDGSTDRCPEILKKWQALDSRIIVVNQENRGLEGARNSGLEVASGEYTAFIDSDDWVHPKYFQSLLNCMERNNADMVVSGCRKFTPEEEIDIDPDVEPQYRKLTAEEFYKSYYARHMIWARLLRRRDTQNLRFPPEVASLQDTLYNLRIIASYKKPNVYETDTPLYYYLQRQGSLVSSHPYDTTIAISKWYVEYGRDPYHKKNGDWAWLLLLQSITMALSCRYQAYLYRNREVTKQTNELLRIMNADMIKDPFICTGDKLKRLALSLSPRLYRRFRLIDDPTLKDYERKIRHTLSTK